MTHNHREMQRPGGHILQVRERMRQRSSRARDIMQNLTAKDARACCRRNAIVIFTIAGVIIGIVLGFALRPYKMSYWEVKYLLFPGELLMQMLQMLVLPLLVSSLISGMAALDSRASGRMGIRAVIYYTTTTVIAVFIGIIMVMIIQPGKGAAKPHTDSQQNVVEVSAADAILDLIRNMFPPNLVQAFTQQFKTQIGKRTVTVRGPGNNTVNGSSVDVDRSYEEDIPVLGTVNSINTLGLIVFSTCFGLIISRLKEHGQPLRDFFDCLNDAIMKFVAIIMWYAPVGILFLIAGKILEMEDPSAMGEALGLYTITVIVGLLIHSVLVLPFIYFLVTRKNPFVFIGGVLQALVTALGTSSSSATLPITFKCLEENNGLDKRVTRFILPVGATINMDGTALYEAVAAIFIAQVNSMDLNFGQILIVSIAATAASIGAAGIPQAGLVTMLIVLNSVGLPGDNISLIIAVDWFLDRLRTTTNVLGDSIGAGVVEFLSRHELRSADIELEAMVLEEIERKTPPCHPENEC